MKTIKISTAGNSIFRRMQYNNPFVISLLFLLTVTTMLITSCKKQNITPKATASLTIVNAVVGTYQLMTNFNGGGPIYYNNGAAQINYGLYYAVTDQFGYYSGEQHLALFNYPDTLSTSKPVVNLTLNLPGGSIKTLFVSGTVANPDTLLVTDKIPFHPIGDSTMSLRFVNLSKGSAPISINISGQPNGSLVASLPYRSITRFLNFPAKSTTDDYRFEFRDAASGTLIAVYNARSVGADGDIYVQNKYLYRSNTVELFGQPGGTDFYDMQRTALIGNF